MNNHDGMNNLFQTGVILGRITQLSIDCGAVLSVSGMGLVDLLNLLSEELPKLPVSSSLVEKIICEIHDLSSSIYGYQPGFSLDPDDSRIMIGLVSRWTDMLMDELNDANSTEKLPGQTPNGYSGIDTNQGAPPGENNDISTQLSDVDINTTIKKFARKKRVSLPSVPKDVKEKGEKDNDRHDP